MIRKTVRQYRRKMPTWDGGHDDAKHTEVVYRTTWWLLFIPIWSSEIIQKTNI